jgi:putative transposase
MILSNIGVIANVFWHEIQSHSRFFELDAFVVMPKHIHGILILNNENVTDTVGKRQTFL